MNFGGGGEGCRICSGRALVPVHVDCLDCLACGFSRRTWRGAKTPPRQLGRECVGESRTQELHRSLSLRPLCLFGSPDLLDNGWPPSPPAGPCCCHPHGRRGPLFGEMERGSGLLQPHDDLRSRPRQSADPGCRARQGESLNNLSVSCMARRFPWRAWLFSGPSLVFASVWCGGYVSKSHVKYERDRGRKEWEILFMRFNYCFRVVVAHRSFPLLERTATSSSSSRSTTRKSPMLW